MIMIITFFTTDQNIVFCVWVFHSFERVCVYVRNAADENETSRRKTIRKQPKHRKRKRKAHKNKHKKRAKKTANTQQQQQHRSEDSSVVITSASTNTNTNTIITSSNSSGAEVIPSELTLTRTDVSTKRK